MAEFASFADVTARLGNRASRKVDNNTYLQRRDGETIALRLHATDILTFQPDGITYRTGGWQTVTTKARMNSWGPVRVWQERRVWYVSPLGPDAVIPWWKDRVPFFEGMRVSYTGTILNPEPTAKAELAVKHRRALAAKINRYATLCAERMPEPNLGDCFYCAMATVDSHEPLGDAIADIDHLQSHLAESYVVGSLIRNASREANPSGMRMQFPDMVRRDVAAYLRKRLMEGKVSAR